jgi:hypothetical protein
MTYDEELNQMQLRHANERLKLVEKYALKQNPYKIGDKIRDRLFSIVITSVRTAPGFLCSDEPTCYYIGIKLNKDLTPNKRGATHIIWQEDSITL